MTFRNADNHPVTFIVMEMIICQLLTWDCPECKYVRTNHDRTLFIPRCVHLVRSIPEIFIPQNHAAPYRNPNTGKEAPFITMGPFCSTDTLFLGVTGDLQLYTTEEVVHLRSTGVVKPSSAPSLSISTLSSLASLAQIQPAPATLGLPKISPGSPKVELEFIIQEAGEYEVLQRVTSVQFQWLQGAAHHWRSLMNGTMMQITKGTRRTKFTIRIMKGVRSMSTKTCSCPKHKSSHHWSAP